MFIVCGFFDDGHSDQYELAPHLNWEIGFDTCTVLILYIKLITNENLLYSTGNSVHCGELIGKEVQREEIYIYMCVYIYTYIYIYTHIKEMATYSGILAWRIPWMQEPGRLQSVGSQRVRHALVTKQQQRHAHTHTRLIHFTV